MREAGAPGQPAKHGKRMRGPGQVPSQERRAAHCQRKESTAIPSGNNLDAPLAFDPEIRNEGGVLNVPAVSQGRAPFHADGLTPGDFIFETAQKPVSNAGNTELLSMTLRLVNRKTCLRFPSSCGEAPSHSRSGRRGRR